MSESKATQSYQAFDSIRQRFGGSESTSPQQQRLHVAASGHEWSREKAKTRRHDSRAVAAPPTLLTLVEESDQLQTDIAAGGTDTISQNLHTVKGKWKHSNFQRSNHLNGPDFDALETASTASWSSAYSSRSSDSGARLTLDSFSPTNGSSRDGSVTELLSDSGSCDTFQEYDIKSHQSRTAQLRASFEVKLTSLDAKFGENQALDPPDDYVRGKAKSWNKVIGEWIFPGVTHQLNSPSQSRGEFRPPSNEIRVPTPLSTPVYGSTENLLDSGSHTSLLSNGSEASEDCYWSTQKHYKFGKFITNTPTSKGRRFSTSSLTSQSHKMGDVLQRKTSDFVVPDNAFPDYDAEGLTPKDEEDFEIPEGTKQTTKAQQKWPRHEVKGSLSNEQLENTCDGYSTIIAKTWLKAFSKINTPTQQDNKTTDKKTTPPQDKTTDNKTTTPQDTTTTNNKTTTLRDNKVSQATQLGDDTNPSETRKPKPQRTEEEPTYSSIVEQRASVFGGTRRRGAGLRRTQSFQVGPRNHGNSSNSPLASKRRSHVIVKRTAPQFV